MHITYIYKQMRYKANYRESNLIRQKNLMLIPKIQGNRSPNKSS